MSDSATWAIVPVKRFAKAKQRLSPLLTAVEREQLCRAMLDDLFDALAAVPAIAAACIVTDEPDLETGVGRGPVLRDPANATLNDALEHATRFAMEKGAATCCVLHADLPLASAASIGRVLEVHAAACGDSVTLVTDRRRQGTNVLVCTPADAISFRYGEDSLAAHRDAAAARGIEARIVEDDALALDIDLADDLRTLAAHYAQATVRPATRTYKVVDSLQPAAYSPGGSRRA